MYYFEGFAIPYKKTFSRSPDKELGAWIKSMKTLPCVINTQTGRQVQKDLIPQRFITSSVQIQIKYSVLHIQ